MKKKVLAVDDSATVRMLVRTILEDAGYDVLLAEDGREALSTLLLQGTDIDMVVTDLKMPNMDGIELIREMRSLPEYRAVPVIMLTSETQYDLRAAGKAAGASCWLHKPFKSQSLVSVVRTVLPA